MQVPRMLAAVFILSLTALPVVPEEPDGGEADIGNESTTDLVFNSEATTDNEQLEESEDSATTEDENSTEVLKSQLSETVMNRTIVILMRFMDQDTLGRFESEETRQLALDTEVPCLASTLKDVDPVVLDDTLSILERHVTCVQDVLDSPGGTNDTAEFQAACSNDDEQIDKTAIDAFKACRVFIGARNDTSPA